MPKLKNAKHELFCKEYLVDLNATRAYTTVYNAKSNNTARTNGSKLLAKANIARRLKELMDRREKKVGMTAESIMEDLKTIKEKCMEADDKEAGACKALELAGRHLGMWNDKLKVGVEKETLEQVLHKHKGQK